MAERVYIETTVVSYLTARPNRDVVIAGHQQVTHEWWDTRRASYELCVSQLVLDEAGAGDAQAAQERLLVLQPMLVLETTAENILRGHAEAVFAPGRREGTWSSSIENPFEDLDGKDFGFGVVLRTASPQSD